MSGYGTHLGERAGVVLAANLSLVHTHVLRSVYAAMRRCKPSTLVRHG